MKLNWKPKYKIPANQAVNTQLKGHQLVCKLTLSCVLSFGLFGCQAISPLPQQEYSHQLNMQLARDAKVLLVVDDFYLRQLQSASQPQQNLADNQSGLDNLVDKNTILNTFSRYFPRSSLMEHPAAADVLPSDFSVNQALAYAQDHGHDYLVRMQLIDYASANLFRLRQCGESGHLPGETGIHFPGRHHAELYTLEEEEEEEEEHDEQVQVAPEVYEPLLADTGVTPSTKPEQILTSSPLERPSEAIKNKPPLASKATANDKLPPKPIAATRPVQTTPKPHNQTSNNQTSNNQTSNNQTSNNQTPNNRLSTNSYALKNIYKQEKVSHQAPSIENNSRNQPATADPSQYCDLLINIPRDEVVLSVSVFTVAQKKLLDLGHYRFKAGIEGWFSDRTPDLLNKTVQRLVNSYAGVVKSRNFFD